MAARLLPSLAGVQRAEAGASHAPSAMRPDDAPLARLVNDTIDQAAAFAASGGGEDDFDWSRFEDSPERGVKAMDGTEKENTAPAAAPAQLRPHGELAAQLEGLVYSRAAFKRREIAMDEGERRIGDMGRRLQEAKDDLNEAQERCEDDDILEVLGWEVRTRAAKHKDLLTRKTKPAPERENDTPWYYGHLMVETSSDEEDSDEAGPRAAGGGDVRKAAAAAAKRREKKQGPSGAAGAKIVHATIDDLAPGEDTSVYDDTDYGGGSARLAACLDSLGQKPDGLWNAFDPTSGIHILVSLRTVHLQHLRLPLTKPEVPMHTDKPDWRNAYADFKDKKDVDGPLAPAAAAAAAAAGGSDVRGPAGTDEESDDEMPPLENPNNPVAAAAAAVAAAVVVVVVDDDDDDDDDVGGPPPMDNPDRAAATARFGEGLSKVRPKFCGPKALCPLCPLPSALCYCPVPSALCVPKPLCPLCAQSSMDHRDHHSPRKNSCLLLLFVWRFGRQL